MPSFMKELTSSELILRTKTLVTQERRITLALIEHLAEISRRMLYAELGYSSLWDFATRELGLSEGAAQRRIQAMRLVRDVPEAAAALESGSLSLSNAAKVQSFRQAEKKMGRKPDPRELVTQVANLSQRECEKTLFEISPEALPRESDRILSATEVHELKIVISSKLHEKLQLLKGFLAHSNPDASYGELLEYLATEALLRLEKQKGIQTRMPSTPATAAAAVKNPPKIIPPGRRGYLPVTLRKQVWAKSDGRCEFTVDGRRCSSRYRLEVDHIKSLAISGSNEVTNLRVLCWHHNQQQALEKLGRRRDSFKKPAAESL
ncbi:MAG: HNH endonuclease [Methylotenera sp.]|nr:HNH endonuclease [Oligoflexia bacterium]